MIQGFCLKPCALFLHEQHVQLSAHVAAIHAAPCATYSVYAVCLALWPDVTQSDLQVVSQYLPVMQSCSHSSDALRLPYGAGFQCHYCVCSKLACDWCCRSVWSATAAACACCAALTSALSLRSACSNSSCRLISCTACSC